MIHDRTIRNEPEKRTQIDADQCPGNGGGVEVGADFALRLCLLYQRPEQCNYILGYKFFESHLLSPLDKSHKTDIIVLVTSNKQRATSNKQQATSNKQQVTRNEWDCILSLISHFSTR